jgi:hypothetical protein
MSRVFRFRARKTVEKAPLEIFLRRSKSAPAPRAWRSFCASSSAAGRRCADVPGAPDLLQLEDDEGERLARHI